MPIDEFIEGEAKMVATPRMSFSLIVLIGFHHVDILLLCMERNKYATAKNEFVLEEVHDFVTFCLEKFFSDTNSEEASRAIEAGETIGSSTLQPFELNFVRGAIPKKSSSLLDFPTIPIRDTLEFTH